MSRMKLDKKAGSSGLKLILLRGIGEAVVTPAPDASIIRDAIAGRLTAAA